MNTMRIPIGHIAPDPDQPRKKFDAVGLKELAASINANGLLQPISVRPAARRGHFIIVLGERRWRAHQLLVESGHSKFSRITCLLVRSGKTLDRKVRQLVENVARQDMTLLEEADAIAELAKTMPIEDIATRTGMVEFKVRWRLQLQNLTPEIRKMVAGDQLDRQQAMEVARLEKRDQTRIVQMINRRELVGWKAVRNAVDAILEGQTSEDLFGEAAGKVSDKDVAELNSMERKVLQLAGLVASGWREGQCIVAARVSPDRASHLADKLAVARQSIIVMERELRNVTAQAKIVLAE
jgi:ParB/RepB/Spo0J family partition protein